MNTDGLWSITSSAGAAGMRPSTGCNLPWPCTVRLDRPLAPGWFWTKRRCSCWKCMISCFRTENLENKPFWNLSSCPGPQDNQCCQEGRELSNRLGGGCTLYLSPLSWLGTLRAVSTNMGEVRWEMAQAEVRQKQEQRQTSKPGLQSQQHCRTLGKVRMESTGRDARMLQEHLVGNSGAELAGPGKRPAKEQRESPLFACVPALFLEALTSDGEGCPCVRSDCEVTGLIPHGAGLPACQGMGSSRVHLLM